MIWTLRIKGLLPVDFYPKLAGHLQYRDPLPWKSLLGEPACRRRPAAAPLVLGEFAVPQMAPNEPVNNSRGETSRLDAGKDLPKSKRYKLLKKLGLR